MNGEPQPAAFHGGLVVLCLDRFPTVCQITLHAFVKLRVHLLGEPPFVEQIHKQLRHIMAADRRSVHIPPKHAAKEFPRSIARHVAPYIHALLVLCVQLERLRASTRRLWGRLCVHPDAESVPVNLHIPLQVNALLLLHNLALTVEGKLR